MENTIILLGWGLFLLLFVVSFLVVYLATDFIKGQSLKTKIIRILVWFLPLIAPLLIMALLKGVSCIFPDGIGNASKNVMESTKEPRFYITEAQGDMTDEEYLAYRFKVQNDFYDQRGEKGVVLVNLVSTDNVEITIPQKLLKLHVMTVDGVTKIFDHNWELLKEYHR